MAPGTRIIAFASGKGGAGKTTMAVNIGLALGTMGARVCLLDADFGLSNVDLVLGLDPPERTLEDVLFSGLPLEKVIVSAGNNLDIIPGSSGISRMAELGRAKRTLLAEEFKKLDGYDFILIDNSPGLSQQVVSLCLSARELILVVNPEVTSLVDAYALAKVLRENGLWIRPRVIVNRAGTMGDAKKIFSTLSTTVEKFLGLRSCLLGVVPVDAKARTAFNKTPFCLAHPHCPASRCVQLIARRIFEHEDKTWKKTHPEEFWESALTRIKQRPRFDLNLPSPQLDTDLASYAHMAPEELGSIIRQRAWEMDHLHNHLRRRLGETELVHQAGSVATALHDFFQRLESLSPDPPTREICGSGIAVLSNQQEMRQILSDMLSMLGYGTQPLVPEKQAEQGGERPCLAIVNNDRPFHRIRTALDGVRDVPLVFLGEYGCTRGLEEYAARIVAVLPPPISLEGLRTTLEKVVGRGRER